MERLAWSDPISTPPDIVAHVTHILYIADVLSNIPMISHPAWCDQCKVEVNSLDPRTHFCTLETFCDLQNASGTIGIRINDGANDISLLANQSHGAYGTFVFNDKFVMEEDDDLDVYNSVTAGDWYVSYIDQDWT